MIKCVLFDLDGVLVDACEWHYQALNQALQEVAGISISREEHETTFNGLPSQTKLNILSEQGRLNESDHEEVWKRKQDLTEGVIKSNAVVDSSKVDLHQALKTMGIRVGCVTNSIRRTALLMLKCTGQRPLESIPEWRWPWYGHDGKAEDNNLIHFVLTNEDVTNPKPNPEGYLSAITKFAVFPSETLIVEDSDKGFQAATDSGAHVMRVKNATEVTLSAVLSHIESLE